MVVLNSNDESFKKQAFSPSSFAKCMLRYVASTELYGFKSGVPLVERFMANMKKQQYGTFLLWIWGIYFFILILNHYSNVKGIIFKCNRCFT